MSLRAFRFQKTKKSETPGLDGTTIETSGSGDTVEGNGSHSNSIGADDSSQDSPIKFNPAKRMRVLSDSEDGSSLNGSMNNGNESITVSLGQPSPQILQAGLQELSRNFPQFTNDELKEVLKECNWNVQAARANLTTKKNALNKKMGVKRHQLINDEEEGSDSDEGEYDNKGLVYNSDDDDSDEDSDGEGGGGGNRRHEVDDKNISDDKRKVLNFFNDGTEAELACLQGISKKKVQDILELRPYEGWNDLVRKVQIAKNLNTDVLNNCSLLLKMREAIAKLMEKCEKITDKMEMMVEELTNGDKSRMELTEQPKNIPSHLKLKSYQMIGLNWLVLMHRQSLNGILADEMGLGKTVQAASFLAHLKEMGDEGPHLIIVPSSTMENWQKELTTWCPSLKLLNYYGSQDERRLMRLQIVNEDIEYDVILTTYNMVISSADDRVLFRKLEFHYVIFDEAHMLKNMTTNRYDNLMRVRANRKLLLTGTPLQNNLVELMSLLVFVMPDMFEKRKEHLTKMFSCFPKSQKDDEDNDKKPKYEKDRIAHAKRIMKPFFLRRLKSEVLTDLPKKTEEVIRVPMSERQSKIYYNLVTEYKERAKKIAMGLDKTHSGVGLIMDLRKAANHPLLIRDHYDSSSLKTLAKTLKRKDAEHQAANEKFIYEDLYYMSDYYIHKTCLTYRCIENYSLGNHMLCDSGKFALLDDMLPQMQDNGDRVLVFTQFTMVLDIMEQYLRIRGFKYLRLDGQTPVQDRQPLIDNYNKDDSIFIFILSTKAGGLGINLTSANTVILHDLDFNPYNDKQAEDRCHRVGQTRPVRVIRFMSEGTIEEVIYSVAQEKLQLEQDLAASDGSAPNTAEKKRTKQDLSRLLKLALDVELNEKQLGEVDKVYTEL